MTGKTDKSLVRRARAGLDVADTLDHHLEVLTDAAGRFTGELKRACAHIRRHSTTGSPRFGHELNAPALRFWRYSRHPFLVFDVEFDERIEVC